MNGVIAVDYLLFFTISVVFGAAGAILAKKASEKFETLYDIPNERSSHSLPIPRAGGSGLFFLLICLLFFNWNVRILAILTAIIAGLGLLEDIRGVSPVSRLVLQFMIVFCGVAFILPKYNLFLYWFLFMFFAVFIVWTTNLYNFMDGINGIAAISGAIAFGFLGYFAYFFGGSPKIALVCVGVSGVCIGFLPFNFPKAKVFMGDVGSLGIGFLFAFIVLMLSQSFIDFICLVSFLFMFYADELVTMAIRIFNKENLFRAHRKHFYQILANEKRVEHWKISLFYALAQVLVGISVLIMREFGSLLVLVILISYFFIFVFFNYKIRKNTLFNAISF